MRTRIVVMPSPCAVYIGRAGRGEDGYFGNPYAAGRLCARCQEVHTRGGDTLACYELYLRERLARDPVFRERVAGLRGRELWCPGRCTQFGRPCHGSILIAYIDGVRKI